MTTALENLFRSADNHAEDSGEPDHAVGDLQALLRMAWGIMTIAQRLQFLQQETLEDLLEAGSRDEFSAETLINDLRSEIAKMESEILSDGYSILEGEGGFFWANDRTDEVSEDFYGRADAVASAYKDMLEQRASSGAPRSLTDQSLCLRARG
jgi:hypothetical protein